MANQVSNVGFTDYGAEQADIERRRQYAQALSQQGMAPQGDTQMAGGWAIRNSPFQGLGKMLQAYSGRKGQEAATEEQKQLGQRYQADLAQTLMRAQEAGTGTPAKTIQPDPQEAQQSADYGTPEVGAANVPAMAPDRQRMAQILMGHPGTAPMAAHMLAKELEPYNLREGEKRFGPGAQVIASNDKVKPLHFANTGGTIQGFNQETGMPVGPATATSVSPDAAAKLQWAQYEWANMSPAQKAHLQNESLRTGVSVQQLMFDTGQRPAGGAAVPGQNGPMPTFGLPPQQASQQPPMQPQAPQMQPPMAPQPAQQQQPQVQPRPAQPMPQGAGAPAVDPNSPIINQVTPKERQQLLVAKPHAEAAATTNLQNIERLGNIAQELHDHPGLSQITGKVNQYSALDVKPETRAARGLQSTLVKQVGMKALADMREASKTGGAVGNVTEKEWPILQQSIAALDDAQSTPDYQKALKNLQAQIQSSGERIKRAYEQTYGGLSYEPVPHTTQGRGGQTAEGKIVNWADLGRGR